MIVYGKECDGVSGVPKLKLPPGTTVPTDCPKSTLSTSETASFAAVFAGIGAL